MPITPYRLTISDGFREFWLAAFSGSLSLVCADEGIGVEMSRTDAIMFRDALTCWLENGRLTPPATSAPASADPAAPTSPPEPPRSEPPASPATPP